MTTGLYWYLHYARSTRELSHIIVMDQSGDEWLQDGLFKKSGHAKAGEKSAALIERYRKEMLRRVETNPRQAHKKAWVEASADYALTIDKLWKQHPSGTGEKEDLNKQGKAP